MAGKNAPVPLLLIFIEVFIPTALSIHTYLDHYEAVHFDHHELQRRHLSYNDNGHLDFHFKTVDREYHLRLHRSVSPLTTKFTLYHDGRKVRPDLAHIYQGHVKGIPGSRVNGAILDGHFKGSVSLPGQDTFYIEPNTNKSEAHHSVMYTHGDLKRNQFENFCGLSQSHLPEHESHSIDQAHLTDQPEFIHTRRTIRTPDVSQDSLKKHICTLRLTADHRMWDFMYRKNDRNSDRALNEILFMIESHVRELNDIFGNTVFTTKIDKQAITFRGIQFEIRQVQIIKPEDCRDKNSSFSEEGICKDGLSSEILLQQYSKLFQGPDPFYDYAAENDYPNYPDYYLPDYYYGETKGKDRICLNFLFTARVLFAANENSILGQAYNAQVDKSGGVCFPRDNVGMVTILQNTDLHNLPHVVTMNVFAHEVGHSFGAKHDDGKDCVAYVTWKDEPENGFYLMHSIASQIRKRNNRVFSNCSIEFVARVLTDKFYTECFEDSNVPFCGNSVLEPGEDCDCGTNITCTDKCCYAKGENPDRPDLDCTLKPTATCSPSQGPCCDGNTCKYIGRSVDFICENAQPCMDALYCDGENWKAKCPPPRRSEMREDGFVCNRNGRVCEHGQCNSSVCNLIGWRECQSYNDKEKLTREEREDLCYVGCRKNSKSDCISTHDFEAVHANAEMLNLLTNLSNGQAKYSIQLPMGTPCNKMTGYCDVFYRCRGVDPDTPLVRLKNCITSGECVKILQNFLQEYWWAVLLCSIAFLVVFSLFLFCCTVHTKSNNPIIERRHPHRSLRDDIRTMSTIQRSLRRHASTLRRSLSTSFRARFTSRSDNYEPRTEKVYKDREKHVVAEVREMEKLNEPKYTDTETDIEHIKVEVHDDKCVGKGNEMPELQPLQTDKPENG